MMKKVAGCFDNIMCRQLYYLQQCPLHSVHQLTYYMRNIFYQLQSMWSVGDNLA